MPLYERPCIPFIFLPGFLQTLASFAVSAFSFSLTLAYLEVFQQRFQGPPFEGIKETNFRTITRLLMQHLFSDFSHYSTNPSSARLPGKDLPSAPQTLI